MPAFSNSVMNYKEALGAAELHCWNSNDGTVHMAEWSIGHSGGATEISSVQVTNMVPVRPEIF